MLDLVQTIKDLLGITTDSFDFVIVIFGCTLIFYTFGNLLGILAHVLDIFRR